MKTIATLVLGLCVLGTSAIPTIRTQELVFGPLEVSSLQNQTPCMSKKISGKVPLVPRMKCRPA